MSLSPRQAESVEQWLDGQRHKTHSDGILAPPQPSHAEGRFKERLAPDAAATIPDRSLHVRSRLSRFRNDADSAAYDDDDDGSYIDPVECFLRVCSACLASAALAVGAVTFALVRQLPPPPASSARPLDARLGWAVAVPVSAVALAWQLVRLSLLAWHTTAGRGAAPLLLSLLLLLDLALESLLGVGSVICAVLAAFQAARHAAANNRPLRDDDGARYYYRDVGPSAAVCALLGLLALSSFGILALAVVEANRRRRRTASSRSTSSSVIEIIA